MPRHVNTVARFYSKIQPQPNGCHLWTSAKDGSGYGSFLAFGKNVRAHRLAWELVNGPIPKGMLVCHRCDVPLCVNVDHLWLGTNQDNMTDMVVKGRSTRGRKVTGKLRADLIEIIRKSKLDGGTLARRYGVTRQAIWKVRKGQIGAPTP